jgi:hypothetical protein
VSSSSTWPIIYYFKDDVLFLRTFNPNQYYSLTMVAIRALFIALVGIATSHAFTTTSTRSSSSLTKAASSSSSSKNVKTVSQTALYSSSIGGEEKQDLFKAGFLANCESEAADLAAKKIRNVKDLGWTKSAKRAGNTRPRHWAWGGVGEKAVQDKPNYDESSSMCVEKWLSLPEFYNIVKDDTAVADTIFVALAGGGAFVERDVAETVLAKWRPNGKTFDTNAFMKTVQGGRTKFATGWGVFASVTGFSLIGIIFPTNPVQLALVDFLESVLGNDAKLAALAETVKSQQ